jgi:hypothetical protein
MNSLANMYFNGFQEKILENIFEKTNTMPPKTLDGLSDLEKRDAIEYVEYLVRSAFQGMSYKVHEKLKELITIYPLLTNPYVNTLKLGFFTLIWTHVEIEKGIYLPVLSHPGFQFLNSLPSDGTSEYMTELNGIKEMVKVPESINIMVVYSNKMWDYAPNCIMYSISSFYEEIAKREVKEIKLNKKKLNKPSEMQRENALFDWLRMQGVNVEKQVKTSENHVFDLWIPGQMILELKASSVTANDVCQCIEYAVNYNQPIILVGDSINSRASKGLSSFNLISENKILYLSWDTVTDYLKARLSC